MEIKCYECEYAIPTIRKHGTTYHCSKEVTNMDVTYYFHKRKRDEVNDFCPIQNNIYMKQS